MQLADRGAVSRFGTPLVVAVAAVLVGIGLTVGLNGYFAYLGVSVVVAAIALLGLGVVTGSAGDDFLVPADLRRDRRVGRLCAEQSRLLPAASFSGCCWAVSRQA